MRNNIRVALVGVGNCASALLQGIAYYNKNKPDHSNYCGLMHADIAGYSPSDITIVSAFDIDERKVNNTLNKAIFSPPNCTPEFFEPLPNNVVVRMGQILDGYSEHMGNYPDANTFKISSAQQLTKNEIVKELKKSGAEIMLNYLPVGSEEASKFYAQCALDANLALINNMPTFIASSNEWANKFKNKGLPIIGDDIKSQLGATITHRALADIFSKRGVKLEKTYQLNAGGNTDFLNMKNSDRLESKKTSKTEAVQSALNTRLESQNIHVGPSDYIPWQKDNKICFIRMEGKIFGGAPVELELKLSVIDSPNSAGVVIDAIRCAKLALQKGISGVLKGPSAYFCKHPPEQISDSEAFHLTEKFIKSYSNDSDVKKEENVCSA
jgi:myo-inositol-1-phosphate synthase